MTGVVLDSGGLSRLAERSVVARERLRALRDADLWPPVVPAVVLTESLTGDHRRDVRSERLLSMCDVRPVDEPMARRAARLRFLARRGSGIDAIVVAAAEWGSRVVVTQDHRDLAALAVHTVPRVTVERV